jgi:histidyl-tRNA synthetase
VFSRSLGEATDVVSKEMYTFDDRGGDSVTLRPEFTAGIARAYLTNGWQQYAPMKLSVHGPLFRYERPQKGRYRQFHQIDAEIIGAAEPLADIELLLMADQLLRELRISHDVRLQLNTLGDSDSRDAWRRALVDYFHDHRNALSEDSVERLSRNPLRILDSKNEQDRIICRAAPMIDGYLSAQAQDFFSTVTAGLDAAGVAWERNSNLVRGLDYYRHTAFEFVTDRLGAQGTVLGGGRYDGLIENLGGSHTPAVGWAAGIERLAMLLPRSVSIKEKIGLVPESPEHMRLAVDLAIALRNGGLEVELLYSGNHRKMPDKLKARGVTSLVFVDKPDRPDVLATLNVKSIRRFPYPLEKRLARILQSGLKVTGHLELVEEYEVEPNFRVDLAILHRP